MELKSLPGKGTEFLELASPEARGLFVCGCSEFDPELGLDHNKINVPGENAPFPCQRMCVRGRGAGNYR